MSAEQRPDLAVVEREGDPAAGLAVVLTGARDTVGLVALAEVLDARLSARGLPARVRVDREAIRLAWLVEDSAIDAAVESIDAALREPVTVNASIAERVRARVESIPVEPNAAFSAVASCLGRLGVREATTLDLAAPAGAARIEAVRAQLVRRDRVVVGVVGPRAARERVEKKLAVLEDAAPAPTPAAPRETAAASGSSGRRAAQRAELTVALPVADPLAAPAAAERLGASPSPIGIAARRLGARLVRAEGTAGPEGGCVALSFDVPLPGDESAASLDGTKAALGGLVRRAFSEIGLEAAPAGDAAWLGERIAREADPRDAAERAAWWVMSAQSQRRAATQKGGSATPSFATVDLPSEVKPAARIELDRALAAAVAPVGPRPARANVRVRAEKGQAETWVLVTNPCALGQETSHRWGAVAQAALAASHDLDSVEPLLEAGAVGFVAHGALETAPDAHAISLAARAASTFGRGAFDAEALLLGRRGAQIDLASRWGRGASGLDGAADANGDAPARLEPFGPPLRLGRFTASELSASLEGAARGPIAVAVLSAAGDPSWTAGVGREVERWLPDDAASPCPTGLRPKPGRTMVHADGPGGQIVLLFGFEPSPDETAAAEVIAELFQSPTLSRQIGLGDAASWRARVVSDRSGGLLILSASGPNDSLEAMETAARSALTKLGDASADRALLDRAAVTRDRAELARLADPRERLLRLALDRPLRVVHASGEVAQRFAASRLAASSAAVIVAKGE